MRQWVRSFEAHSGDYGTKRSGQNGHSKAFAAELFFARQLLKARLYPSRIQQHIRRAFPPIRFIDAGQGVQIAGFGLGIVHPFA